MNLVVKASKWREEDLTTLFGDESVEFIDDIDLSKLAVQLGAYKSTSQARKSG